MDDLEGVGDDADGQELLAVVTTLHHERVDQSLDDGHLGLLELLLGVAAGGVGDVDGMADLNVVGKGDVLDLNTEKVNTDTILDKMTLTPGCPTFQKA